MNMSSFKKTILIFSVIGVIILIFSAITFGKGVLLPAGLLDAVRSFFAGNPELHACDYKDGEILLIKPIATGVGEGRFEAGDIVSIKDGEKLCQMLGERSILSETERTRFLPVYYPGKLTEEQKKELTSSEYESNLGSSDDSRSSDDQKLKQEQKILLQRQVGVDYTKFLSDSDILKVRNFEKLDRLPEIDLSVIVKKPAGQVSAVSLPQYLIRAEEIQNAIKKIAGKIIRPALAATELVHVVDPGLGAGYNYDSLYEWNAGEQGDLTGVRDEIAVAKCRATSGTPDTTAVTIDNWTTDADHYIKIWTDPSESYRHNGKWDGTKYNIEGDGAHTIKIDEVSYVHIDGLQISASSWRTGIMVGFDTVTNYPDHIYISNCIIRDTDVTQGGDGIYFDGNTGTPNYIWNNIIYGFDVSGYHAITLGSRYGSTNGESYIYNNTIYDCGIGITTDWNADTLAKNNLIASTTDPYSGTFYSGTDYNSTDINDTPTGGGSNNKVNQKFLFADTANKDFRLSYADLGAANWGTSLSGDTYLPFNTDAAGNSRPFGYNASSTKWDIGAVEYRPIEIYRSVGPGVTAAVASSTGQTLKIENNTATFSSSMPANMGVGDVIVYQSANGTDKNSVAFVYGRSSAQSYTVKDVSGHIASSTVVAGTTNWQVFRAYTSLSDAEAGIENSGIPSALQQFDASWSAAGGKNLASSTEQWNIACYADAADTDTVAIDGWTTTADNYIKIYTPVSASEVGTSQRHNGKWDDAKYNLSTTMTESDVLLNVDPNYVYIDGLQLNIAGTAAYRYGIVAGTQTGAEISNNIVRFTNGSGGTEELGIWVTQSVSSKVYNNIVYDAIHATTGNCLMLDSVIAGDLFAYNNTVYNCVTGIITGYLDTVAKNNLSYNNTDNYSGSFDSASDYNLSNIADDAPGDHSRNGVTVQFVDAANDDFHLQIGDTAAIDNGADLSRDANLPFTTDIDGEERRGKWAIGADQQNQRPVKINTSQGDRLADGLVGEWTFDAPTIAGISVYDQSSSYATGTMNGSPTKAIGISGQALSFDGVDDYINAGDINATDGSSYLTVSAWVKHNALKDDSYVVSKYDSVNEGWFLKTEQGGNADEIVFGVAWGVQGMTINNVHSAGNWEHWVGVFDGTKTGDANRIKIYLNGVQQELTHSGVIPTQTLDISNSVCITGRSDGGGDIWNGLIDEVRVYNRALGADEIKKLYNLGSAKINASQNSKITDGLVGLWSFNGNDMYGTTAIDRSGLGNNGTLTGANGLPKLVAGKVGQALSFDGVDDYVATTNQFNNPQDFTIAVWFKTSLNSGKKIVGFESAQTGDSSDYDRQIWVATDGYLRFGWGAGGVGSNEDLVFNDGRWHFAVGTHESATNYGTLYVDGNYQDSVSGAAQNFAGWWRIGGGKASGFQNALDGTFPGSIDEVRVYNRVLTSDEIKRLYNMGR